MVQIAARLCLFFSLAAIGVSATPVKRDFAAVVAHIADISTKVKALDSTITNYPATGGTLAGALAIHNNAAALVSTLQTATAEVVSTGPVTDPQGEEILTSVEAIKPDILHALLQIVIKRPAFVALPLGGVPALVKQDLGNLDVATLAFGNALIDIAPARLIPQAIALRDEIAAAFDVAIAGYP